MDGTLAASRRGPLAVWPLPSYVYHRPGTGPPTEADARCGRDPAPTCSSAAHRPAGPRRHPVTARTRPLRVSETPPASTALTKIATALPGTLFSPRQPSPRTSGVYAARLSLSSIRPCRGFAPSRYGAFSSAVTRRSSSRSRSTCRTETSRTTWETGLVILRTRWARSSPPAPALLSPSEPAEPLLITGSPTIVVDWARHVARRPGRRRYWASTACFLALHRRFRARSCRARPRHHRPREHRRAHCRLRVVRCPPSRVGI